MSATPIMPSPIGGFADPFAIMSAFFLHVGARNIQFDFTEAQKKLLAMPQTRMIVLFAMFYISTRSLLWSVVLVVVYFLLVNMLLNENHPLNVFSRPWLMTEGFGGLRQDDATPYDLYLKNLKHL